MTDLENIWFSTFRLINSHTAAKYTERTCGGQKPHLDWQKRLSLSSLQSSSHKWKPWWAPSALWWLWLKPKMRPPVQKNTRFPRTARQITGTAHPSGKNALMILSPSGLMANSGILWKSSRLQAGGEMWSKWQFNTTFLTHKIKRDVQQFNTNLKRQFRFFEVPVWRSRSTGLGNWSMFCCGLEH